MHAVRNQRLLATGLIFVSALWYWLVMNFIEVPAGTEGPDSRTFPLFFGALLAVLSALLWIQTLFMKASTVPSEKKSRHDMSCEAQAVGFMILSLVVYALLLEMIGFMLGTIVTLTMVLGIVLGVRCAKKISLITLGLSIGTYLIFKQVLGVYLPMGSLINIGM